jgi:hypothetical protein
VAEPDTGEWRLGCGLGEASLGKPLPQRTVVVQHVRSVVGGEVTVGRSGTATEVGTRFEQADWRARLGAGDGRIEPSNSTSDDGDRALVHEDLLVALCIKR